MRLLLKDRQFHGIEVKSFLAQTELFEDRQQMEQLDCCSLAMTSTLRRGKCRLLSWSWYLCSLEIDTFVPIFTFLSSMFYRRGVKISTVSLSCCLMSRSKTSWTAFQSEGRQLNWEDVIKFSGWRTNLHLQANHRRTAIMYYHRRRRRPFCQEAKVSIGLLSWLNREMTLTVSQSPPSNMHPWVSFGMTWLPFHSKSKSETLTIVQMKEKQKDIGSPQSFDLQDITSNWDMKDSVLIPRRTFG